jgi:hypothetical protein
MQLHEYAKTYQESSPEPVWQLSIDLSVQIKRELRVAWLAARQAAKAAVRATRADRDDAKHIPHASVIPPRRCQCRPACRADNSSSDGETSDASR